MDNELSIDAVMCTIRSTAARHFAGAAITAVDNAEQEGHSLTQVQQVDITTMLFMAHAEFMEEVQNMLKVELQLKEVRGKAGNGS
jgi:hypothetical protein